MATVSNAQLGEAYTRRSSLLEDVFQRWDLLLMLTNRDIKIRYKQSLMGFLWAILMPILIIGSGLIVMVAFSTISGRPIDKSDVLSVAVKAVPWAFFVASVRFATNSLISNRDLVTKIYFPREILPISAVLANLFDFGVAAGVLSVILLVARVGGSLYLLWVPLLLTLLVLFTFGLALLLSCANLFFRDVKYLVEVVLTYGIFFTPIFYSAARLGKWGWVLMLNPLGPILEGICRSVVLHSSPPLGWLLYSAGWAVIGSFLAWKIFRKSERAFAESI